MKFKESSIANEVFKNVTGHSIAWGLQYTEPMIRTIIEAFEKYLAQTVKDSKSDKTRAIVIKTEDKKSVIFAAVIENHKDEGYTITYTFDPKAIPEDAEITELEEDVPFKIMNDIASEKFRMHFKTVNGVNMMNKTSGIVFASIKEYLRNNLGIDPILEIPGFVEFKATVVDDKLHIIVTPDATVKQLIKDDLSGDKKEEETPETDKEK